MLASAFGRTPNGSEGGLGRRFGPAVSAQPLDIGEISKDAHAFAHGDVLVEGSRHQSDNQLGRAGDDDVGRWSGTSTTSTLPADDEKGEHRVRRPDLNLDAGPSWLDAAEHQLQGKLEPPSSKRVRALSASINGAAQRTSSCTGVPAFDPNL